MNRSSETLCPLAWTGIAYYPNGTYTLCCRSQVNLGRSISEALQSEKLKEIKKKMLAGKRPEACALCFEEEDLGLNSTRKSIFRKYQEMNLEVDYESLEHKINTLDLRLSNLCNLKCRMCWPFSSSKIHQEYLEMLNSGINLKLYDNVGEPFWPPKITNSKPVVDSILDNMKSVRYIYISGGEPFMDKSLLRLLNEINKMGMARNIRLYIHTNGTVVNDELLHCLSQFEKIILMISIDGVGRTIEYQRTNINWDELESNLKKICGASLNISVMALPTVTIYNALYMDRFLSWYTDFKKEYNLWLGVHFLVKPAYLSVNLMPENYKKKLIEKMDKLPRRENDKDYADFIVKIKNIGKMAIPSNYSILVNKLKEVTDSFDSWRGQHIREFLPESAAMIEDMIESLNRT